MLGAVLSIIVCILVAGFFSGSETGAYSLNRIRLRHEAESGSLVARMLQRTVSNMERFVCMTLVGTNVSVYGATAVFTVLLVSQFNLGTSAKFAGTLILAPVLLVFNDLLPKSIFRVVPNRLMRWTAPGLWAASILCWPLVTVLYGMVAFWRRALGGQRPPRQIVASARQLDFLLSEGREEGVITAQQDHMVRNIMQCHARTLRQTMIPLERTAMIRSDASGDEAAKAIAAHDHARLPVYDGARDNVVGILLALDYLSLGATGPVREVMRPTTYLSVGLRVDRAFRRLQDEGQTMAVVVDEQGHALGIVTTGDVLQEIFGATGES